jgi:ATP dependent DNA ligase domain
LLLGPSGAALGGAAGGIGGRKGGDGVTSIACPWSGLVCTPTKGPGDCSDDLRPDPLEGRKATLEMMLAKAGLGIRFNEHMEGDGETVFRHACKLGLEGIVSKRKDSAYRSGRSPDWLKIKNADAPAVKREAEEDWSKQKWR